MAEPAEAKPAPRTTLQYLILYPTLLLSLGGSLPTVLQALKAWRLDTTYARVQIIEEQHKLWEKNVECLTHASVWEVDGPQGVTVKVTICDSGDTLLRYYVRDWTPRFHWVALPTSKEAK